MSRDASIPRWGAGVVLLAALFFGSCGSGAVEGPEADTEAAERQADGNGGGGDIGGDGDDRYSWNLPVGDVSPDESVSLYLELRKGCDEGEAAVEEAAAKLPGEPGRFPNELIRLYRAAVAVCRGDVEGGRALYSGAENADSTTSCLVREAILSVLEQRPQDISECRYGLGEEETTTTDGETTTSSIEGEDTTTTASIAGGGEAPTEPDGEGQ